MMDKIDWSNLPWRKERGAHPIFFINGAYFIAEVGDTIYVILRRGINRLAAHAPKNAENGDYFVDDRVNAKELFNQLEKKLGKL